MTAGRRPAPQQHPELRALILTTFGADEYVYGALRAGASGFLLKDARGHALLDPPITRTVIEEFARRPAPAPSSSPRAQRRPMSRASSRSSACATAFSA